MACKIDEAPSQQSNLLKMLIGNLSFVARLSSLPPQPLLDFPVWLFLAP